MHHNGGRFYGMRLPVMPEFVRLVEVQTHSQFSLDFPSFYGDGRRKGICDALAQPPFRHVPRTSFQELGETRLHELIRALPWSGTHMIEESLSLPIKEIRRHEC